MTAKQPADTSVAPTSPAPQDTLRVTKAMVEAAADSFPRGWLGANRSHLHNAISAALASQPAPTDDALRELLKKWEGYRAAQLEQIPLPKPEDDRQARTVLSTYGICIAELKRALSSCPEGAAQQEEVMQNERPDTGTPDVAAPADRTSVEAQSEAAQPERCGNCDGLDGPMCEGIKGHDGYHFINRPNQPRYKWESGHPVGGGPVEELIVSGEPPTWIAGIPNPEARAELTRLMALVMNARLNANSHKGGWRHLTPKWLLNRLRQETGELRRAVDEQRESEEVWHEAADVANFAAMIADTYEYTLNRLGASQGEGDD